MNATVFLRHVKKFTQLPLQEKQLFIEAFCLLFAAKGLLLIVPFKYWLRLLAAGKPTGNKPDIEQLKQLQKAIRRAGWLTFWKNQCIVRSVALRWMLQRRQIPSLLSLGVLLDENRTLKAHAWLTTSELSMVENDENYLELYRF